MLTTTNENNYNSSPSAHDGPSFSTSKTSPNTAMENVHFADGDMPWIYDIKTSPDKTAKLEGFEDAQLGEFLRRPLQIQEYRWTPGTTLFEHFNPWTDYFGNADVKEKINRFRNLRCDLCIKVVLNGNQFYYGRAMLSYNPYIQGDQVTMNRFFFSQDIIAASNKPHFMIDPCSSEGGQMTLPFIWPENYLDITRSDWASQMGECTIHDFDILSHANGGTDPITVCVFAWAQDVHLCIPTTVQVQSDTTSSVELDEFGFPVPFVQQAYSKNKKKPSRKVNNMSRDDEFIHDGLISKPASAIAKAASMLTMIPYIGPYAKATSMVAGKIGSVARLFGYSRPPILTDKQPVVPQFCGNLSNTDAPETVFKLTTDSKNELSIDTRTFGLGGTDELTIQSIASRLTYWRQFDWPESARSGNLLASMAVQPFCIDTVDLGVEREIHSTAMAFAAGPFEAWQGSIIFHFKIICSEYHRGRLRFVYNPVTNNSGSVPFNQVYSTIIDIEKDRECDYEVKWTDVRAWNACLGIGDAADALLFSTTAAVTGGTLFDNGTLSVYVVNELATPSTTPANVKIQVWVSAGDDFALSIPSNALKNLSYFKPQAEMQSGGADTPLAQSTDNSNNPIGGNPVDSFGTKHAPLLEDEHQYVVYQGERIVSFKQLLRRYQYHNSFWPSFQGTGVRYYTLNTPGMPLFRGYDSHGIDEVNDKDGNLTPYNFCTTTLLNYLAPAFVCQRGSLRHKWIAGGFVNTTTRALMTATRHSATAPVPLSETSYDLGFALKSKRRRELLDMYRSSFLGSALTPIFLNNTLEIENPYYSLGQRFRPARFLDMAGTGDNQGIELACEIGNNSIDNHFRLDQFVSVGEDFTLGMFVGAPVLYSYINPQGLS